MIKERINVGLIVAHPDDETLWAGGTILMHPHWGCKIFSLCRASDPDRSVKFFKALDYLNATGKMTDLDDGPDQLPLDDTDIQKQITELIEDDTDFDILITHSPSGEYTRHKRHEETSRAVINLWSQGKIKAKELWLFAYEDGGGKYSPKAITKADMIIKLSNKLWERKKVIINEIYGFDKTSWEYRVTPKLEGFWQYHSISEFNYKNQWKYESISTL